MPATDPQPACRFVTRKQCAGHFNVSDSTLERNIRDGKIVAYRIGRRALRIDLNEAEAALLGQETELEAK